MATEADVERLALALPGVVQEGSSYRVGGKLLAWSWLERVHPKRARLANPDVLVVRVANEARKFELVAMEPDVFFTEPHYNGYAAILVRLPSITVEHLREVLDEGWQARAPKELRGRVAG